MKRKFYGLKNLLALVTLLGTSQLGQAQVGIGTNAPHPSAQLEINATDKGLLVPRMTQTQREQIAAPATGLMVYQTDNTTGFYYYNGNTWGPVEGTSGTSPAVGFSASVGYYSVSTNTQFMNWIVSSPDYSSPHFNSAAGSFTVPASGKYAITATIPYNAVSP